MRYEDPSLLRLRNDLSKLVVATNWANGYPAGWVADVAQRALEAMETTGDIEAATHYLSVNLEAAGVHLSPDTVTNLVTDTIAAYFGR